MFISGGGACRAFYTPNGYSCIHCLMSYSLSKVEKAKYVTKNGKSTSEFRQLLLGDYMMMKNSTFIFGTERMKQPVRQSSVDTDLGDNV